MNTTVNDLAAVFPNLEKELLEEMQSVGEWKTYKEGDVLMRTGQNIRSTMLIIDGLVKVYREDVEGNEFFMYYLDSGKACALSFICAAKQETSEITAKADTPLTVLSIPLSYMDQWMIKYKTWYHFVLGTYRSRFEELLQTIDHIAFRNLDQRLVYYLKQHQEKWGNNSITASMTDIAQDLNSSREVVSRLMKKLSERGMVKISRNHIELINLNLTSA